MSAYDVGAKIGIDGEAEFKKAVKQIENNLKTLGSEMKMVVSQYDKGDKSAEALTAQNKVLTKQIQEQTQKVLGLREALSSANDKYGESHNVTQDYQRQINNSIAELNKLNRKLEENEKAFESVDDAIDDVGDGLKDAGGQASTFGDMLKAKLTGEAIMAGVKQLAKLVKDLAIEFVETAATVQAETAQFEAAFEDLADTADERFAEIGKATGVMANRLKITGTKAFSQFKGAGLDAADALEKASKFTESAADAAAYYDISLEEASEKLRSFIRGNTQAGDSVGLFTSESQRNAKAVDLMGDKYINLTEAQKQMVMLNIVDEIYKSNGALGQAAREADGYENVMGNLRETWRQFTAVVGTPILQNTIPVIQGLTSVVSELTSRVVRQKDETTLLIEKIQDENKAWEEAKVAQQEKAEANVAEIDYTKRLWGELQSLADKNGKVTDANQTRAKYIMGELNKALGTELQMIGDQIQGLENAAVAIDELIAKKRAQIILDSQEEQYAIAKLNISQKQNEQSRLFLDIERQKADLIPMEQRYQEEIKKGRDADTSFMVEYRKKLHLLEKSKETYTANEGTLNDYYSTITNYEETYAAIMEGNLDRIKAVNSGVGESFKTATNATEEQLKKQVAVAAVTYADIQKKVDEGVKGVTQTMADEALKQYNNALKEYEKIGRAIPDGLYPGIDKGKLTLKTKVTNFLAEVKSWFTGTQGFDTHSPSKWSAQIMEFVTQGMVIGLENGKGKVMETVDDLTSELKGRVSTALSEIGRMSEGMKLEYDLWERTAGRDTTEEEKSAKQAELLNRQMEAQAHKIIVVKQQYQKLIEQYGEQHELSAQAYNDMLKEQIAMADLTNKADDLNKAQQQRLLSQKEAYEHYLKENQSLLNVGVSQTQLEEAARRVSGYNVNAAVQTVATDAKAVIDGAMVKVESEYKQQSENLFGELVPLYRSFGQSYANAIGEGFREQMQSVIASMNAAMHSPVSVLTSGHSAFGPGQQQTTSQVNISAPINVSGSTPLTVISNEIKRTFKVLGLQGVFKP